MSSIHDASPTIPAPVRAVLELFEGPLAELSFPDIDRAVLERAASEVDVRRAELQRALDAVCQARTELEASQAELLTHARKAHAYARVFAGDDAALAETLDAIKLDPRALAPKRPRGRPRKAKPKAKGKQQTSLSVAGSAA